MTAVGPGSMQRMVHRLTLFWRRIRRGTSRRGWTVRLLGLKDYPIDPESPGVILLQIDGLSRMQFERAIHRGRLPFLKKMLRAEDCRLDTFYSGLPSTTPAVQAELFYGIRCAVPAFAFRDSSTGQSIEMIQPSAAAMVEQRLAAAATGLLNGGSAYSNIYTGGAAEPHYCASVMGAGQLLSGTRWWRALLVIGWNVMAVIRTAGLVIVELVVAISDFLRGISNGRDLLPELKLIPSRVLVAVMIRELIVIGAEADATRGVPIIQANFLAYDEQSHGRGPGSALAHWSLRKIDAAIQRIVCAARVSQRRDYQIWIYSDHGQQSSIPYQRLQGRSLTLVVNEIREHMKGEVAEGDVTVAAKGPLGHIYLPKEESPGERDRFAERLAHEGQVPWVLAVDSAKGISAWHRRSRHRLPEDKIAFLGSDHPFADTILEDLEAVCRHPDAGDLVVLGWQADGPTVSFVRERGTHAGPGPEETRGFILVPADAPVPVEAQQGVWRPGLLRNVLLEEALPQHRSSAGEPGVEDARVDRCHGGVFEGEKHWSGRGVIHSARKRVTNRHRESRHDAALEGRTAAACGARILTYNIHSCLGIDGRLSPRRIARVIRHCDADIVALQEVDVRRTSSGKLDQAARIAEELQMEHHFFPSLVVGEEQYGNVILSRFPIQRRHFALLPNVKTSRPREPRAALWVSAEVAGIPLQLVTTHLGLNRQERMRQVEALLGPDWLGHPDCRGATVLCGDFNAGPGSPTYQKIASRMADAQEAIAGHRPINTWRSSHPLLRLDHVFLSRDLIAQRVLVPRTYLARVASDHRPLVVDVMLRH